MFLPLGDDQPRGRFVYVSWLIIAFCIIIYAYQFTSPIEADRILYVRSGALIPAELFGDRKPGLFALIFTLAPLIGHSYFHFDIWQLLLNIVVIFYFGQTLERRCGGLRFAIFYTLCGIVAGYCQADIAGPESTTAIYGASGAAAGVIGGYLSLMPQGRMRILSLMLLLKVFTVTMWIWGAAWFAAQAALLHAELARGFTYLTLGAGFAAGIVSIYLFRVKEFDPQPDEEVKPRRRTIYDDLYHAPPPPTKSWDE